MRYTIALILFAQYGFCNCQLSDSNYSSILSIADNCFNAVTQGRVMNTYGQIAIGNKTSSVQLIGQMCVAAALRSRLEVGDAYNAIYSKTTAQDLEPLIHNLTHNMDTETRDLTSQASRITTYKGKIGAGTMSAIVYHFDTMCGNTELKECENRQQFYCSNNSCWSEYQMLPLYKVQSNDIFVRAGFPIFASFNHTKGPLMALAKTLALNAVRSNQNNAFQYEDATDTVDIGLQNQQFVLNAVVKARASTDAFVSQECDKQAIYYAVDENTVANGPFPFVVEQDNDGICILAINNNLLISYPIQVIEKDDRLVNAIGAAAVTGFCKNSSTAVVRGSVQWEQTIPINAGGPGFFVPYEACMLRLDTLPSTAPELAFEDPYPLESTLYTEVCKLQYCSDLIYANYQTGGLIINSRDSFVSNENITNWPRAQADNTKVGNSSTDGFYCNTRTANISEALKCIRGCYEHKYIIGEANNCLYIYDSDSKCFDILSDTQNYRTNNPLGFTIDVHMPDNQTGPGTQTYDAKTGKNNAHLDTGKPLSYTVKQTTSISNTAIAYNQQIGSIYERSSCWQNLISYDINNYKTDNNINNVTIDHELSLISSLINTTTRRNTTGISVSINKCANLLTNEALSDPNAATLVTAANTVGSSIFAFVAVLVAALAKEYEHKLTPTIKNKFVLRDKNMHIIVNLIVGCILLLSIAVGIFPVAATLYQEVHIANKIRTYDVVMPDEDLTQINNLSAYTRSKAVVRCLLKLPPQNYRLIVTAMVVMCCIWSTFLIAMFIVLLRRTLKHI